MTLGNVLPIDAESARILARRNTRFRWFVAALTTTWLAALIPAIALSPLPPIGPLAVLAVLMIAAEHRFVFYGDETAMSGSIIIVTASGFAFDRPAVILGAMLVASLGSLYWGHIRGCRFTLILANAAALSLAAGFAASLTSIAMHHAPSYTTLAAVAFTCCYWCANSMIVGAATSVRHETRLSAAVGVQMRSDTWIIILAVASALIAHSFQPRPMTATALALVALLLAVDALHFRAKRYRNDWARAIRSATEIGLSASLAFSTDGPMSVALLLTMAYVLHVRGARYSTAAHLGTLCVAVLMCLALDHSGVPAAVQFTLATTASYVMLTTTPILRNAARATQIGWPAIVGLLVISKQEALRVVLSALAIELCLSTRIPECSAILVLVVSCTALADRGTQLRDATGTSSPESAAVSSP